MAGAVPRPSGPNPIDQWQAVGHTQASTTQRYAHLDADPLRRASNAIGEQIAAALAGKRARLVGPPKRQR